MLVTLVDRMTQMGARCVRVVAGAGWGKSAFARVYASLAPAAVAIVDCRGMKTLAELDTAVSEALRTIGLPSTPHTVLTDWTAPSRPSTVIFDGLSLILRVEHAIDRIRTLLRTLPPERNVVLCSRIELPIVWSTYFAPHEIAAIGSSDLAIDADELELLFAGVERPAGVDERILTISQGWPIAVLLFVRLAANGRLESALEELGDATTFGDLHAYVQAEIFDALAEGELEALCAVVALGGGTLEEISLAIGRDAEADLDHLSGRMRYLLGRKGEAYVAVPLARAAAEMMQRARVRGLTRDAIGHFRAAGRFVRAAELALQIGDDESACAALDDAAAPVPGFAPGDAYVRAAMGIGVDYLARSRNVLTIVLAGHLDPALRWELAQKIDARWHDLDADGHDTYLRTVLRIARAYLLRLSGNFEHARQSARGAERDLALLEPDRPIVRALQIVRASLAFNFGDLADGEAAWAASGESPHATGTFFAGERIEANVFTGLASADTDTIARAYMDAIDELSLWHDEHGRMLAQICAASLRFFTTGHFPIAPDTAGATRLRFDTASLAPHADEGAPFERAARFRVLSMIDAALAQSDIDVALDLLAQATEIGDRMGIPLSRVLPRVVSAAIHDGDARAQALDEAILIASGPLRTRVEELRAGTVAENSIFFPFLHGIAMWKKVDAAPMCRIEIMRGQVICRGDVLRLRGREHELLVALALAPNGTLTREALTDRLWPDQDEGVSAGSLRSTLHRLRQQLRGVHFVLREGNQYRLSPDITVDVTEAEALYSALRRESSELNGFERGRLERQFESLAYGVPDAYTRWSWFMGAETRLVDLRHGVGMLLARDDFNKGNFTHAVRWTEQLIDFDPLDEVAAELLFQSIVRSGGRTEAARWLRRYRDLLAREYGMEPSFELDRAAGESDLSASA